LVYRSVPVWQRLPLSLLDLLKGLINLPMFPLLSIACFVLFFH
jgi:hypothetical protein